MPITDIKNIRILPPLTIARLGSSSEPMDNYDLIDADNVTGFRKLVPAATFRLENNSIIEQITPDTVQFRDADGNIKPVSPFLEVWAVFEENGDFEPLTKQHLDELGLLSSDLQWRAQVGNLKAFRRTGDNNDKIIADTGYFNSHNSQPLLGKCNNFKANKNILFGSAQYIEPNENFPELRLRYVPAVGAVFGADENDPNISNDVYDRFAGSWDDHVDGTEGTPMPTAPSSIFRGHFESQTGQYVSDAYLDDACDGVIEVSINVNGNRLTSFARISSAPPDFAPDSYPVRSVADELEQIALGANVTEPVSPSEVSDIIRRALETVRLMNTEVMNGNPTQGGVNSNSNNMAGQDSGNRYRRAFEPIFLPALTDASNVRGFHAAILSQLENGTTPTFLDHLRKYDEVAELSDIGRRKMPAMMRGSDGNHLALTRRQRDKIRVASDTTAAAGGTAEQDMATLIDHFQSRAVLHASIDTDANGNKLSDLFSDAAALMRYLENAKAKGSLAGTQLNRDLVVAGDPDASAFMQLIRRVDHPMAEPFSREVPNTGRSGLQIVERWIRSL